MTWQRGWWWGVPNLELTPTPLEGTMLSPCRPTRPACSTHLIEESSVSEQLVAIRLALRPAAGKLLPGLGSSATGLVPCCCTVSHSASLVTCSTCHRTLSLLLLASCLSMSVNLHVCARSSAFPIYLYVRLHVCISLVIVSFRLH